MALPQPLPPSTQATKSEVAWTGEAKGWLRWVLGSGEDSQSHAQIPQAPKGTQMIPERFSIDSITGTGAGALGTAWAPFP